MDMRKNKIVLLIPFYGKVPIYFNFYLKSLKGKILDVFFFTDIDVSGVEVPSNFRVIHLSFAELHALIKLKLGVEALLPSTRKLCDYKPFYGKIFEDYTKGYDYWAHGDCDLVYGEKFNDVLETIIANAYDVATMRRCWMSGAFSMFRNDERLKTLYRLSEDWKDVVCHQPSYSCFDECRVVKFRELEAGKITIDECRRLGGDSLSALVWRQPDLKFFHEDIICEDSLKSGCVKKCGGRLYFKGREQAVFHYIGAKPRRYFTYVSVGEEELSTYLIDEAGFYVSPSARMFRPIIRSWRKIKAFYLSVRYNGMRHWVRRLVKLIVK